MEENASNAPETSVPQEAAVAPVVHGFDDSRRKWYAIQTRSNMEQKMVETLKHMIDVENMGDYISKEDVLMPEERVSEIRAGGKGKTVKKRKLYPGYIFVKVRLFDEDGQFLEKPWYFLRGINGFIGFMGGGKPVPLRAAEIDRIFRQIEQAESGVERPKVSFEVGEEVKITEGPFMGFSGNIDEIDTEKGKLKVSVSIFGRFTPVELEYGQVQKTSENA